MAQNAHSRTSSVRGSSARSHSRLARLLLEQLEDRIAPATLFRVNAGGDELAGSPVWTADTDAAPAIYSNAVAAGSNVFTTSHTIDLTSSSIPAGTPEALFQSERWDASDGE